MKYLFYELLDAPNALGYSTIQILRTGKFKDEVRYGEFEITSKDLDTIARNFENEGLAGRLIVDYNHGSALAEPTPDQAKSAGKIMKLVRQGKDKLFAVVKWTKEAIRRIEDEEYLFISPEFHPNYSHPERGAKKMGAWLLAVALTNRPFLKGMDPVALSESAALSLNPSEEDDMTIEELKKALAEAQAQVKAMTDQIAGLEGGTALTEAQKTLTEAQAKVTTLTEQAKTVEAKTTELEGQVKTLTEQLAEAQKGDADQVKTLRDTVVEQTKALKAATDRLDKVETDSKAVKAEALLDGAVRTHKLSKAERDSDVFKTMALNDPDTFEALVAAKHPVVPAKEQGNSGDGGPEGPGAQAKQFNELVETREAELKTKNPDDNDRQLYSRALREVTAENPTLAAFNGQSV